MNSIIQVAETHFREVDSNTLTVHGDIGVIDEYVPHTNPDYNNLKSGRRSVVINLNSLKSIEVDSRSSVKANNVSSLKEALINITDE